MPRTSCQRLIESRAIPTELAHLVIEGRRRTGNRIFLGEAPPARVMDVLAKLQRQTYIPDAGDRNALGLLVGLRVIESSTSPVLLEPIPAGTEHFWLASKVLAQSTVKMTMAMMRESPNVGVLEIGQKIEELAQRGLSEGSMKRYGSGVLVWVNWLMELSAGTLDSTTGRRRFA